MLVNVKLNAVPWVALALAALVIPGAWSTVRVNACVAVPNVLVAVIVSLYTPPWSTPGAPPRVAVPFPLSTQVTPCGRVPLSVSAGAGAPEVFTVKVRLEPSVAVAVAPDVIFGAALTVRTKDCVVVPAELVAVNVMG